MKSLRALGAFLICGCADVRDVFVPYHVRQRDIEKITRLPMPPGVIDAALVLGCPANRDGSPSLCQRCRVNAAVRQYQLGRVRYLIVTGGAAHTPSVEADVMGDLAEEQGVPRERVVRETRALSTWQNARYSLALTRARGWRTLLVVSTADHLPRARRILLYHDQPDSLTGYLACDLE